MKFDISTVLASVDDTEPLSSMHGCLHNQSAEFIKARAVQIQTLTASLLPSPQQHLLGGGGEGVQN